MIAILLFFLGALVSSFGLLLAERLPEKKTIFGKSACPHCQHSLRLLDVFPLLGYLVNLGKCHYCKHPISIRYLLSELLGGVVFTLSYCFYGFTWEFFILLVVFTVLFIETGADILHFQVIDWVWAIGLIPLLIIRIINGDFLTYLLSASVMFSLLFLLAFFGWKLFKKEALGGGDVKLYFFIGFVLTIGEGLLSLFLAAFSGFIYALIFRRKDQPLPLVPFIAFGVLVAFFWGDKLITWYVGLL